MLGLGSGLEYTSSQDSSLELNWLRIHYNASQAADPSQGLRMLGFADNVANEYEVTSGDTIRATAQFYLDPTQHVSGDGWNGTDDVSLKLYFGGPNTTIYVPQSTIYNLDITHTVTNSSYLVRHYLYILTSVSGDDKPLEGARFYMRNFRMRSVDANGTGEAITDYTMDFTAGASINYGLGGNPFSCYSCVGGLFPISQTLGTTPPL